MSYSFLDSQSSNARVAQKLVANRLVAQSAIVDTLTNTLLQSVVPGKGILYQVIAYAPVEFASAGASSPLYMNTSAGVAQATALTSAGLLILPTGAQIVSVKATNNGTLVNSTGGSFNVGVEVYADARVGSAQIFNALLETSLNLANGSAVSNAEPLALGSAGSVGAPLPATAAVSVVSVTNSAIVLAGDMALLITYLL
jgi:hypothetical protein